MAHRLLVVLAALVAAALVGRWAVATDSAALGRSSASPLTAELGAPAGEAVQAGEGSLDLVLDVGSPDDADPSAAAHLDEVAGLSERKLDGGRSYRDLDPRASVFFRFSSSGLTLADNGVPYRHAVLTVEYRDTVDETHCYRVSSTRAYCRPRIYTRLDYGANPPLEWHALGAVAGLNSGEWATTSIFIESNPWQTLRSVDGFFEFKLYYPRQEGDWSPLPLDRITLSFMDDAAFHALREEDRAARTLVRSDFVEQNQLDPGDYDGDFVLYARNYLQKIYPNSVPSPSEITSTLSLVEVPGEREPVTFAIYALSDLRHVAVQASELLGAAGVIAADRVHVQLVEALDKRWMFSFDKYYGSNPWYLDDNRPFDLQAGSSKQVWITIDVPPDGRAGVYSGVVTVEASGDERQTLDLTLTVVDVDLGPPAAVPYVYHSPYMAYKHFAPSRSTAARDMAAHDINPIIYLDATIDVGSYSVDFKDLGDELDEFASLGILPPEPRVGISDNVGSLWRQLCPGKTIYVDPCGDFDAAYTYVLAQYRDFFRRYGVTPALSFTDEPGNDPDRRMRSNYLNRLTHEAGMRTWVTYYPRCEEPLAGHHLTFEDHAGDLTRGAPDWLTSDPAVRAYWDFEHGTADRSRYANDGQLRGTAAVDGGELVLPDQDAYMLVPPSPSLDLSDQATVYLWMRPEACASGYARHPVSKTSGTDSANYVLYFFGDYDGKYPENAGLLRFYANIAGRWTSASGSSRIDCTKGVGRWHNIWWTYRGDVGGTLFHNGEPSFVARSGSLANNEASVVVGRISGVIDDVLLLDRALTDDESMELTKTLSEDYDREQTITLTLRVEDPAQWPSKLTMSLYETAKSPPQLETTKRVLVNGVELWSAVSLPSSSELIEVDLSEATQPGQGATISFSVTNGYARSEDLRVYFVEDAWRAAGWSVQVTEGDGWSHELDPDPTGSLGPMAPYLDDRVHAMRYVTKASVERTLAGGDSFSYYTTYPANQPVILNNRFLNGIYASAVGAEGVYVYAYGDWGSQPWDDAEPSYLGRLGTDAGKRGQGGYQLVLPSWEDRVYDTVVFESLREGIEDSRVIGTLERAIAEHPGPLAEEARSWLDDLYARPSGDYSPRYMHADATQPIQRYADRSAEILEDLAGDADDFAFFDRMRRRMLDYIVALERSSERPWDTFMPYCLR